MWQWDPAMSEPDGVARTATASVLFVHVVGSAELRGRLGEEAANLQQALDLVDPRAAPEKLCLALGLEPMLVWLSGDGGRIG